MKLPKRNIEETLRRCLPSASKDSNKEVEELGTRVLHRLRAMVPNVEVPAEAHDGINAGPMSSHRWRNIVLASAAAVLLVVSIGVIGLRQGAGQGSAESLDGTLLRNVKGRVQAVGVGDRLTWADAVHTTAREGATFVLADGSHIEMRSNSELSLERTDDGVRIHLARGSVIVNAAKQRQGHLSVQTKDMTVSVVGTVFFVNAVAEGSRVAVIEGEVHVQEDGRPTTLLSGEQLATIASHEPVLVAQEISWSRQAPLHLALLQQSTAETSEVTPEFEVASVRLNASQSTSSQMDHRQERVTIANATPEQIIRYAYSNREVLISGPSLLKSKRYDIVAKAPSGTPDEQLLPMLKTLLRTRFKMQLHHETIEMPVYALTIVKTGPKLEEIRADETISGFGGGMAPRPDGLASMMSMGGLSGFASSLSRRMDRPVIDRTGLQGRYRISLSYVPNTVGANDNVAGPSIFTALEEQLGLKLEPQRSPIEIMVIDSIQEPDPN